MSEWIYPISVVWESDPLEHGCWAYALHSAAWWREVSKAALANRD